MICWYCKKIAEHDLQYIPLKATFDTGSETPRCPKHWRFFCELCLRNFHYKGIAYCPIENVPFCHKCSLNISTVSHKFWGEEYYWNCRCPFCADFHPTLDFCQYQGNEMPLNHISKETFLERPIHSGFLPVSVPITDKVTGGLWDENADTWSKFCGPYGDLVRQHVTDLILFDLLGTVENETVLDAGCGEGYLSRLIAKKGGKVCGVENSKKLYDKAISIENSYPLGITYFNCSIGMMSDITGSSMDAIVCNNVFMYCAEIESALSEFARIIKPSGRIVIVMTHPCFWGPGTTWIKNPPDTPRQEEWNARQVSSYFNRTPHQFVHAGYKNPLIFFPRTLGDYVEMFIKYGFKLTHLVEPTINKEEKSLLPPSLTAQLTSLPMAIAFRITPD